MIQNYASAKAQDKATIYTSLHILRLHMWRESDISINIHEPYVGSIYLGFSISFAHFFGFNQHFFRTFPQYPNRLAATMLALKNVHSHASKMHNRKLWSLQALSHIYNATYWFEKNTKPLKRSSGPFCCTQTTPNMSQKRDVTQMLRKYFGQTQHTLMTHD